MEEAEFEDPGKASPISLAELAEVVKTLHSGKGPGVDEIRPEMLRCWKKGDCSLWVESELLPQAKEFKYLGVLGTSEGKTGAASLEL